MTWNCWKTVNLYGNLFQQHGSILPQLFCLLPSCDHLIKYMPSFNNITSSVKDWQSWKTIRHFFSTSVWQTPTAIYIGVLNGSVLRSAGHVAVIIVMVAGLDALVFCFYYVYIIKMTSNNIYETVSSSLCLSLCTSTSFSYPGSQQILFIWKHRGTSETG